MTMARWRGDEIKGLVRKAAVGGLLEGVKVAKERAVEAAPVDTNELRESAYVDVDENTLIAIVGFEEARDIKTIKQHEDLTYKHPRGGGPKFLENPVKRSGREAHSKLAAALRRVMG